MLVLSRRIEESIVIGEDITITVLAVEGDKVKLGIAAPREIAVLRQELWQALQEQNAIAAKLAEKDEASTAFESLRALLAEETKGDE